jgi:hypothetical protein
MLILSGTHNCRFPTDCLFGTKNKRTGVTPEI